MTLSVLARLNHLKVELEITTVEIGQQEKETMHLKVELANEKEQNRLQEIEISLLKLRLSSSRPISNKNNKDKKVGTNVQAVLWPRSRRGLAGNG